MSNYPLRFNFRTIADFNALMEAIKTDAKNGPSQRQYGHASEEWIDAIRENPVMKEEVGNACIKLLSTENNSDILHMTYFLSSSCLENKVFEAAAHRILSGIPIPKAAGCQHSFILEDIASLASRTTNMILKETVLNHFLNNYPVIALRFLLDNPDERILPIFEKAIKDESINTSLITRTASIIGRRLPDKMITACQIVKQLDSKIKSEFMERAISTCPQMKDEIEKILGK